ncbi:HTH-type transcriptional regulator ArgP [Rhodoferax aquaticus]|uniref:ArgP/LysG family DNA-binding transcriptional regulator n=1 Tax=Rhodoferax aquaticus TaxID=2527691 RepID=A0A515EKY9_9BURK|nr:HTH-type transcriptional regulator ArgP [Rhodoferax aquaticus]QDL53325.1 ArgP/LysG family DNA-binding transcriptional regulator [Rhodoferax aquaticus]
MLDTKQLLAFAAVLEHGQFGAAAAQLNLTLGAVSLRIKALETHYGQRLLVRGKTVRATAAGQRLLAHVHQLRMMEADLRNGDVPQADTSPQWHRIAVAVNGDSLSSWFLPGIANALAQHHIVLDVVIDDQEHTHEALTSGDVAACISTQSQAMRGCLAEPLGVMRYRCVGAPSLVAQCHNAKGALVPHQLLRTPAVIFNRKDGLQDAFLAQHLGLHSPQYPRHFVPAVDAFESALAHGMGWGMVSDLHLQARANALPLQELLPGSAVDVALYWHHWVREPSLTQGLTAAVKLAAKALLRPTQ